jgi:hypothetical protein
MMLKAPFGGLFGTRTERVFKTREKKPEEIVERAAVIVAAPAQIVDTWL